MQPGRADRRTPRTGNPFDVECCTVARWHDHGPIVEEKPFRDVVGFEKQLGLSK